MILDKKGNAATLFLASAKAASSFLEIPQQVCCEKKRSTEQKGCSMKETFGLIKHLNLSL